MNAAQKNGTLMFTLYHVLSNDQYTFEPNELGDMVMVNWAGPHDSPWQELKSVEEARSLYKRLVVQDYRSF